MIDSFGRDRAMYIPEHFQEIDVSAIDALMQSAPLACIVADTEQGLIANHLPLLVDANRDLVGHVAMNNEMHRLIQKDSEVLAIFRGSDAYISPNDYPTKQDHHRHVPTWNYQVVHIYGRIEFSHDDKAKRAAVGLLTQRHERQVNGANAWRMADAPSDYIQLMLGNIVAFKLKVTRLLAKSKLSQNREAIDLEGAVKGLERRGHMQTAREMLERSKAARDT